ncbi:uncharacterized protein H6S33_008552 [Morchella sextelata]|uniref:uncharacterized protein n=1 Tax=Morchella sextelata TaxID=1174677 RepID=UPI001D0436DB|nr:uncharacterized protein H6S33_008552 [Morchella sextelata]KAH0602902.1 hypothetical protein H6S33_008552 [Morchella sextelata]
MVTINTWATGSSIQTPIFENCCKKGDVVLEILKPPSDYLKYLLESLETVPRNFRKHIREYNSALTFTSVKYNTDTRVGANGGGISCFQIHGELYHLQAPLVPAIGATPSFAQLYFYDTEYSAQQFQLVNVHAPIWDTEEDASIHGAEYLPIIPTTFGRFGKSLYVLPSSLALTIASFGSEKRSSNIMSTHHLDDKATEAMSNKDYGPSVLLMPNET